MGSLWERRKELDPGQVKILKCLFDNKKRGTLECKTPVTYSLTRSKAGLMGFGRYYGTAGSLETLEREIRATLCAEYYTDIDVVNCHPTLIVQMASKWFGRKMPVLSSYVTAREDYFTRYADTFTSEQMKNSMMRVLYNGKLGEEDPPEFHEMASEIAQFRNELKRAEAYKELWSYCQNVGAAVPGMLETRTNSNGSFLALITMTEERKCADVIMDYFRKKGLSVDVYSYDGCQVRGVGVVSEEMLRECEAAVKDVVGWTIQIKIKPFASPIETIPTTEDALEAAYAEMKTEWEKEHFYFKPTNTIVEVGRDGRLCHFAIDHASLAFNMWMLGADEKGEPTDFLKKWNKDPTRRIIDTLVYKKPEDCKPNEATLFCGFVYEKMTPCENPEAVAQFQNILKAVSGDNEEVYTYNLKWLARMIQDPFNKSGTALVFINKSQGTGKDTLCLWIKKVMGNHVAHYKTEDEYWEKHDTKKEGAIFVYLEEVGSGASKAKSTEIKARLTADSITINGKGIKQYDVPNMANMAATTNVMDPFRIEGTDRRFSPSYGSDRLRGNAEMWLTFYNQSKIHQEEPNPTWLYPIGKFLESMDMSGFNPRIMPENEYKADIVTMSESSEESFIKQWTGEDVPMTALYNMYREYCVENSKPYATSSATFGKSLMGYTQYYTKKRTHQGMIYSRMASV